MKPKGLPYAALGAAVLMVFFGVIVVATAKPGQNDATLIVGLIGTTVPALVAAAFAERASRDIRNGVVQQKTKQGVHEALKESGVKHVVETAQTTQPKVLDALANLTTANAKLLETITKHDDTKGSTP